MSTDREKLEELYGVFSEAAKTKGPYAHIQPKTCGDVADVLGRQIEEDKDKQLGGAVVTDLSESSLISGVPRIRIADTIYVIKDRYRAGFRPLGYIPAGWSVERQAYKYVRDD